MFEKKNIIHCTVLSCEYNESKACNADHVEVIQNNAVVANRAAETACKTFKPRIY